MRRDEAVKLLQAQKDRLVALGVRSLSLFGSVARDEARLDSDVDLLVDFEGSATFNGYMDLRIFLEDLLGRRVDLVTHKGLKPLARPSVERDALRVA